jgi:hypothetical protein
VSFGHVAVRSPVSFGQVAVRYPVSFGHVAVPVLIIVQCTFHHHTFVAFLAHWIDFCTVVKKFVC